MANGLMTFDDLKPRSREVPVGDRVLVIHEFSISKWNRVFRMVADLVNWKDLFSALGKVLKREDGQEQKSLLDNSDAIADFGQSLLRDVLGKSDDLICLAFDHPSNREIMGANSSQQSPHAFASENLTARQSMVALDAILAVNDISDALKKYGGPLKSRLVALFGSVTEAASTPVTH